MTVCPVGGALLIWRLPPKSRDPIQFDGSAGPQEVLAGNALRHSIQPRSDCFSGTP